MMPPHWEQYQTYIRAHERTFIAELLPLLEQPSISHQAAEVRRCAELLRALLQQEGVRAAIMETGGNTFLLEQGTQQLGKRRTSAAW